VSLREQLAQLDALPIDALRLQLAAANARREPGRTRDGFIQRDRRVRRNVSPQARRGVYAAETQTKASAQAAQETEAAFLRAQAGILAQSLQAGEPCPVCGSLDHPAPASFAQGTADERAVKAARAAYEADRKALATCSEAAAAQAASMESIKKQLQTACAELLQEDVAEETRKARLTQTLTAAAQHKAELEGVYLSADRRCVVADGIEKQLNASLARLAALQTQEKAAVRRAARG
jgi:exonuclease SbcC